MAGNHLAIELLAELVRSESISGNELGNVAIYARFAEAAGFVPVVDGRNVWLTLGSGEGPALLLNSHLDTVKAGETWRRDPWDGAIEGDRLHGLGANDAKGSVAAQFAAAVRATLGDAVYSAWPSRKADAVAASIDPVTKDDSFVACFCAASCRWAYASPSSSTTLLSTMPPPMPNDSLPTDFLGSRGR
jgi:hypothetical protein